MPPAGYNTTRLHAGNGLLVPYNLVSNSQRLGARHPAVPKTPKLRGVSPDIHARVILSERTEGRPPVHLEVVHGIPDFDPEGRRELIRAQINELGYKGLKQALKRDIDFIKWNSRT